MSLNAFPRLGAHRLSKRVSPPAANCPISGAGITSDRIRLTVGTGLRQVGFNDLSARRAERAKGSFMMASNSSGPRRPQDKDAGNRIRLTSETNAAPVVLHRAISANDNGADSPRPTNVDQEETSEWLRPGREEIPISSADVARGKAIIIVYVLGAILVMLAWFYLLSLPAMRITEWL
jgi:hypothetical protein